MKELSLEKMEELAGGGVSGSCWASIGGAIVFGTGGVIAAASGPVGWIAFAMAANYFAWGMTAYTCATS